jgi:hypothetical protein
LSSATDTVCIINIGPRQRRRRMRWGIAAFVLTGILAIFLITAGVPRAARLILLLPFWTGALGVFQARGKT